MQSKIITGLAALASILGATAIQAADIDGIGPYAGIGFGTSRFEIDAISNTRDVDNGVLRLYGGYHLTRHFGVEAGYVRTGHFVETRAVDGNDVNTEAKTRAVYATVTGRTQVTKAFTVAGRIGIAYGDVNNDFVAPGPNSVFGSKSSLTVGVGARYKLSERMALALDWDDIAQESGNVSASMVTLSVRRGF